MQELLWLGPIPEQTLEGGIKLLQELKWNLVMNEEEKVWMLRAGHVGLLRTSSRESADAFLYGMALGYSVMPKEILDQLRAWAIHATENALPNTGH